LAYTTLQGLHSSC